MIELIGSISIRLPFTPSDKMKSFPYIHLLVYGDHNNLIIVWFSSTELQLQFYDHWLHDRFCADVIYHIS